MQHHETIRDHPDYRAIALLSALYVAQGLPFGVQATALPVLLRQAGVSLADIGLAGVLALPWMLKALWAPWVDRHGARRHWITGTQCTLAIISAGTAWAIGPADVDLVVLGVGILLLNFAAATQDIAVDGLAVAILGQNGLGLGNAAQVVGYKVGMIIGGGVLVWASQAIGWRGVFLAMAGLYLAVLLATLSGVRAAEHRRPRPSTTSIAEVLALLRAALSVPGTPTVLAVIGCYKLGETIVTAMFKPFLVDAGFGAAQIGMWVGTWGMLASLLGSVGGGVLVQAIGSRKALIILAWLRCLAMVGEVLVAVGPPNASGVIAATCLEHAFGGALTTALFAWMMARVNARIGASHYTLLASVEVLGKLPAAWGSGLIAQTCGYLGTFCIGLGLSAVYAWALPRLLHKADGANSAQRAVG